ncbi:MAG TPA: BatD family protein [Puia sp.]|nr:BatD family protein [Puia sp.]
MHLLRILPALVIFAGQLMPALAQKQKAPPGVNSLFAELPIDDAAGNSILHDGESGKEKIKENIFIIGSLNKSVCYAGEPVLLTYQLYTALQSTSVVTERPTLGNFNAEERPLNNELPFQKRRGEKNYRVFTIWQVLLNPFQPGNWTIDTLSVNNEVSYTSDDKKLTYSGIVHSKPLGLTVLPLPAYKGTEVFSGAMGKFQLHAFVTSSRIAAGETDTLHLEIEGSGNLNAITTPAILWPAGFECYPFKEKWTTVKNAFPSAGKKTVTIPFIAHKEGHFALPSLRLSYFDPSGGDYQVATTEPISLDIQPPLTGSVQPAAPSRPQPVRGKPFDYKWIWGGLAALGIISGAIFLLKRKTRLPVEPVTPTAIVLPASERVAGELETLKHIDDREQYIIGIKAVLSRYLQEKFQTGDIYGEELADILYNDTLDPVLAGEVRDLYSRCSALLYAPADPAGIDRSLAGAVSLIVERCEIHKNINVPS